MLPTGPWSSASTRPQSDSQRRAADRHAEPRVGNAQRSRAAQSLRRTLPPKRCLPNPKRSSSTCRYASAAARKTRRFRPSSSPYVISFLFVSSRRQIAGLMCDSCRSKAAVRSAFFTVLFGWWGLPFGPIYSFQALYHAAKGGKRDGGANAVLKKRMGIAYRQREQLNEALTCFESAAEFAQDLNRGLGKRAARAARGRRQAHQAAQARARTTRRRVPAARVLRLPRRPRHRDLAVYGRSDGAAALPAIQRRLKFSRGDFRIATGPSEPSPWPTPTFSVRSHASRSATPAARSRISRRSLTFESGERVRAHAALPRLRFAGPTGACAQRLRRGDPDGSFQRRSFLVALLRTNPASRYPGRLERLRQSGEPRARQPDRLFESLLDLRRRRQLS